jgi:inositol hexakisphosphate/diphosphoinositol-pentakisphosphate kinase
VDALICFHSDGFPYLMAWKYIQKHRPYLINDFDRQQLLWDRSVVYHRLRKINVPLPRHFCVCRDPQQRKVIENRGIGNYVSDEGRILTI